MNNQPSNYDLVIGFLQVFDLLLNVSQSSNDDILKELQKQDSLYLEKILGKAEAFDSQGYRMFTEVNKKMEEIVSNQLKIIEQNDKILSNQDRILQRLGSD